MGQRRAIISSIQPGSIAEEIGLQPGHEILLVNGQAMEDVIDWSFAVADEEVVLTVRTEDGDEVVEIEKEYNEELGIEFDEAVFDGIRRCGNRCIFCFVDQMPSGMRQSLYVKDDDYRMSFLYGNFITLTNVRQADWERIFRLHLSPLYISVHATDGAVRAAMLNQPKAAEILPQLQRLAEAGIEMHTQVVLCPGYNDGEVLQKTIADLYALHPAVQSLAIVPVGLTQHRQGCAELRGFTPEEAGWIIDEIARCQERFLQEAQTRFVFLGDEFYLAAGRSWPTEEAYEGFPQLENGVGMVRDFLTDWARQLQDVQTTQPAAETAWIVAGTSAAKVLAPLLAGPLWQHVRIIEVANEFFGPAITVTGLLTGGDILKALQREDARPQRLILPGVALRKGEEIFLDDMTLDQVSEQAGCDVRIAHGAEDLFDLLRGRNL